MAMEFKEYMKKFNEIMEPYILPKPWSPVEEALYKPLNFFDTPKKEAEEMRFKAIKYTFKHHYENNAFYQKFCKENNVTPDDIKSIDDLHKIPLLEDKFFKDYPSGKEFALWLANIFTGKLPNVVINKRKPSFEDVITAFNKAGLIISYSSGTSGRHTVIPRDKRTWLRSQYALAKSVVTMIYPFPFWKENAYSQWLMSNPFKTNIFAGKIGEVVYHIIKNSDCAIDRPVTAELVRQAMTGGFKSKVIQMMMKRENKKTINKLVRWLKERDKNKDLAAMLGAPFLLHFAMNKLEEEGVALNMEDRGVIVTGGGWKIYEHERIPVKEFRKRANEILGIVENQILDLYAMVEGNGFMIHCPEEHALHIPSTYYYPLVLDKNGEPVDEGEEGRFAFLDALSSSYPSFIITGDNVKLNGECSCGRSSITLHPEVTRAAGEEMRGCAEEMRKMLAVDLSGKND